MNSRGARESTEVRAYRLAPFSPSERYISSGLSPSLLCCLRGAFLEEGNAMKSSVFDLVGGASAVGLLWSCSPSVAPVWKIGCAIAFMIALIAMTARG